MELGRNPVSKHQIQTDYVKMSRLTRDGTAEPVLRDQILRRERGQGNIHFSCSADHEQDWQPFTWLVDPYSCDMCDHTTFRSGWVMYCGCCHNTGVVETPYKKCTHVYHGRETLYISSEVKIQVFQSLQMIRACRHAIRFSVVHDEILLFYLKYFPRYHLGVWEKICTHQLVYMVLHEYAVPVTDLVLRITSPVPVGTRL